MKESNSPTGLRHYPQSGPTHDPARTLLPLDLRGYYFISQGALAIPRDPRHYSQETDLQASPREEILRAHLCTRVYTIVYTRVYNSVHVGIQLCTQVYTHPSSVGGIR